ncbi:MAG: DMT family transporter [Bacteroidia bacterium]|nr:DMT family transporter [Bacteroidia bacterium]
MKNSAFPGHIAMVVANVLWGLMAPVSKDTLNFFALNSINPVVLPSLRILGATFAFWLLSLFLPKEPVCKADKVKLFGAGLFAIAFNQCLFITGISFTSPIDASVVTTMLPIVTMILSAIVLKEPLTHLKAVGVLVGMSGALLLVLGDGHGLHLDKDHIIGDIMCFTAQVSFACYLVFFKGVISRYSGATLMKWMFLFSALTASPFILPMLAKVPWSAIPAKIYAEIAYTVFVATFFSFLIITVGQKRLRPTVVSMYNYVQPVVSTTISLIWGVATFGLTKGIAIALVFAGVYVVTQSKKRSDLQNEKEVSK